jgi:hypothetical protein
MQVQPGNANADAEPSAARNGVVEGVQVSVGIFRRAMS